ncbi:MAG: hypothetical protein U1D97_09705 [Desulfuromonadales bacterium]|nr:hypothetical protein [Desulfuromonadales bacterium]
MSGLLFPRGESRRMVLFCAVLSVLLLPFLVSCSSDDSDETHSAVRADSVSGIAMLDQPIVGGTVTLERVDGTVFHSETDETHTNGSFLLDYPNLPANFDIVVTGGTVGVNGPLLLEPLRTEVRNHQHGIYAFYLVDPISSLVATYHRAHPELSFSEAVAAVWDYLQLPPSADPVNDMYFQSRHFHRGAFMEAAQEAGGFQFFLTKLSGEIDHPTWEVPCFSEKCDSDLLTGAAGFIAGAVAKGALSYIGSEAAGYVMQEAFGWGEEPPDRQGEIIEMLAQQGEMLENVITEIKELESKVAASTAEIKAALKDTEYNLKAANLADIRAFVDSCYQQLYFITQADPREAGYADLVTELAKRLEARDLQKDLANLHNTLLGQGPGESGLFEIWGEMQHRLAYSQDRYPALANHMAYWYDVQVKTLQLFLEYLHYKYPENTLMPKNALSVFDNNLVLQANMFRARVETFGYVDGGYYSDHSFLYTPRIAAFCWDQFTSPQLAQADRLIGELLGQKETLIVRLYMSVLNYNFLGARFDNVKLQLRNTGTGSVYEALPELNKFEVWRNVLHTSSYMHTEIGRFTFVDVPFGEYRLVDNNALYGHYGLLRADQLIDTEALDHTISFAEANPFAHMTVLAWDRKYLASYPNGCP